jgi:hypothetical protein
MIAHVLDKKVGGKMGFSEFEARIGLVWFGVEECSCKS